MGDTRCALRTAIIYLAVAYGGGWAVWSLAGALRCWASASAAANALSGALLLAGTLMPMLATHTVFPQLKNLGIASDTSGVGNDEPRSGFLRYCFGMKSSARGWAVFGILAVWRWAMFMAAFGFPSIDVALCNAVQTLPALLLGGGFEEIGWRGCLQPILERCLPTGARLLRTLVPSAITGVVWGLWHLPLFAIPETFQSQVPIWSVVLVGMALSFSFEALHKATGNLDSCIASHAWYNAMLVATPTFTPLACVLFGIEALAGACALAKFTAPKNGISTKATD